MKQSFTPSLMLLALSSMPAAIDMGTAFDALKSLEGKWSIRSVGKMLPVQMTYEIGSKGSVVTEQFGKELSVFYRDSNDLVMIHFCNAGNQPRLKLQKDDSGPNVLHFETVETRNLREPDAAHVQSITYKILDSRTMDVEIEWRRGKSQKLEEYRLNRI